MQDLDGGDEGSPDGDPVCEKRTDDGDGGDAEWEKQSESENGNQKESEKGSDIFFSCVDDLILELGSGCDCARGSVVSDGVVETHDCGCDGDEGAPCCPRRMKREGDV